MCNTTPDTNRLIQQLMHEPLQTELSLRERPDVLSYAFERAITGKAIRLPRDDCFAVNRTLGELLGRDPADYCRINLFDLSTPENLAMVQDALLELISGQREHFSFERRLPDREGASHWLLVQVLAVRDAEGCFLGTFTEVQDISAHKRLERALALAKDRQDFIEGMAGLGCWEIDAKTLNYYRSHVALELIGYTHEPNEVPFEQAIAKFHPEERERIARLEKEAIAQDKAVGPLETRILRGDGEVMHVRFEAHIVHDEAGQPSKLVGYFLDITESLRQARQLREANARLEVQNQQIRELARLVSQSLRGPLAELQAKARELAGDVHEQQDDTQG